MQKKKIVGLISVIALLGFFTNIFGMFGGCCIEKKETEIETFNGEVVPFLATQSLNPRQVDNSLLPKFIFHNSEPLCSPLVPNGVVVDSAGMTPVFMDLDLLPIVPRRYSERDFATPVSSFLGSQEEGFDDIFSRAQLCFDYSMQRLKQYGLIEDSIVRKFCIMQRCCSDLSKLKSVDSFDENGQFMQIFKKMNLLEDAVRDNYCKRLQQVAFDICDCALSIDRVLSTAQMSKIFFLRVKKIEGVVLLLCQCYDKIFMYDSFSGVFDLNEVIKAYNLLQDRFIKFKSGC